MLPVRGLWIISGLSVRDNTKIMLGMESPGFDSGQGKYILFSKASSLALAPSGPANEMEPGVFSRN
jgi:hypothetical protein